jgi:hypothetical protein
MARKFCPRARIPTRAGRALELEYTASTFGTQIFILSSFLDESGPTSDAENEKRRWSCTARVAVTHLDILQFMLHRRTA